MDTHERLRQLLNERGWTEYRLAKNCGLSESTIANIYRRNTVPSEQFDLSAHSAVRYHARALSRWLVRTYMSSRCSRHFRPETQVSNVQSSILTLST